MYVRRYGKNFNIKQIFFAHTYARMYVLYCVYFEYVICMYVQ